MDFDEFAERIIESIRVRLLEDGEDCEVRTDRVLKNNGIELTALVLNRSESIACPMVYLEPFYREYREGEKLEDIAGRVIALYKKREDARLLDKADVTDETSARENIVFRFVNKSRNEKLLETSPHIDFNDLAIVFRRVVKTFDDAVATTSVTYSDMRRWRLDEDGLFRIARENTERIFPAVISGLSDMMTDRYGFSGDFPGRENMQEELFIVTNTTNVNGAVSILFSNVLEKCAEIANDDIYLLPSSIHEMLFVRVHAGYGEDFLKNMVREANRTAVDEVDFLSDSVYLYERETGAVTTI